ncbi:MAG TPA: SprT family zinc-dependent metalloprotease [Gammaproteobacteria bacterium]|nr:SprT family zinc-dependent metalloprotease [Gammaproteobacteria bacterium]
MPHITIDDVVIELTRKKVKYLRVAINPSLGNVRVSAPMRMKEDFIQAFLVSRMPWIKKHLAKYMPITPREIIPPEQQRVIDKAHRHQLQKVLPELIHKWTTIIGVELSEYKIKKMKTRWGTCNTRARRIWINLELAKKSLNCLEYIIVHELVHLLERSHNRRFKLFMDQFMPEWRVYREELKRSVLTG